MLRVLQIVAGFSLETLGGVERYTFDLSRALVRLGVSLTVCGLWDFSTPFEQHWRDALASAGIDSVVGPAKVNHSPLPNFLASVRQIRAQLAGREFDIIHSQQEFGDVLALCIKSHVKSKRLVRTVHNTIEWRYRPLRRIMLTHLLMPVAFDLECAINDRIAASLSRRPLSRIQRKPYSPVLPNAIDLQRFAGKESERANARAELGFAQDAFVVGAIGRLTAEKGHSNLLEVISKVSARLPALRLLIVGEGPLRQQLQQQVGNLGLTPSVVFTGARSDVERLLPALDILVSSSLYEAMPTVIIEAMAAGVPVVATSTLGARALIQPGVDGWLVPVDDAAALCEAILSAHHLPEKRLALALKAKQSVLRYSIDETARCQLALYRLLLRLPDDV